MKDKLEALLEMQTILNDEIFKNTHKQRRANESRELL